MNTSLPLPAKRKPMTVLTSRTFAAECSNNLPIGPLIRRSIAASEKVDTATVSLTSLLSVAGAAKAGVVLSVRGDVTARVEHLLKIYERLGASAEGLTLRFLPGRLLEELDAIINEKEAELGEVLRSRKGASSLPLCKAFLRGCCAQGVTCEFSHVSEALAAHLGGWLEAALCAHSVPFAKEVDSQTDSAPSTARGEPSDGPSPARRAMIGSATVLTVDEEFGPEAWRELVALIARETTVHALVLRQMSAAAVRMLSDALRSRSLDHITHLDVSRNQLCQTTPRGALYLGGALRCCPSLVSVDVGHNMLGCSGVLAFLQALAGTAVEAVSFAFNGAVSSDPTFEHLCQYLQTADLGGLRRLSMAGNRLGPDGAAPFLTAIASNERMCLTHLCLYRCALGDRGCKAMSAFLAADAAAGTRLTFLDLGWNNLSAEGTGHIAAALGRHEHLQTLKLAANPSIGRKGAIALAQMLKAAGACPLHTIDLRWTFPTDDGVATIADAVGHTPRLRRVLMVGNEIDPRSEALLQDKLRRHGPGDAVTDFDDDGDDLW